ncbi:hypothetical protein C6P40_004626 [Pichia californica]|uniref:Uncharacterized protein n=1 Tax=Pichia californica TaxID=460514 RepID=A0A9P6WMJ8_9ASCO|nr:hypothetical protein C6P40_004626 [[Candida] californica]
MNKISNQNSNIILIDSLTENKINNVNVNDTVHRNIYEFLASSYSVNFFKKINYMIMPMYDYNLHGPIYVTDIDMFYYHHKHVVCAGLIEAVPIPKIVLSSDTASWIETVDSFDIDSMFTRDVEEHKYDAYDLAWLFAPAKITIDENSWIETVDSFDIDSMFVRDVEEHKYDAYDSAWLFEPYVEAIEEAEEENYEDCDLSWLFPTDVEEVIEVKKIDDYKDCDLSWLFDCEVEEVSDYEDCNLSWLFPIEVEEIENVGEIDEYDISWLFNIDVIDENDLIYYENYCLSWLFKRVIYINLHLKKEEVVYEWFYPTEVKETYDEYDLSWLFPPEEENVIKISEKYEDTSYLLWEIPSDEDSDKNLEDSIFDNNITGNSTDNNETETEEDIAEIKGEEVKVNFLILGVLDSKSNVVDFDVNVEEEEDEDCEAIFQIYNFLTETTNSLKWLSLL